MRSGAIAAACLSLLTTPFAPQVFRSAADAVLIDVLVTDGRKPIAGLTADDFELRDNGVVQRISAVTMTDVPVSLMLAVDTSASMVGGRLRQLKDAAHAALSVLKPGDRGAVAGFSHQVRLLSDWTDHRPTVSAAINSLKADGGTALNHALVFLLGYRDLHPSRAIALVFSDGMDSSSIVARTAVLDLGKRSDVVVYGVVLGERQDTRIAPDTSSGIELSAPRAGPSLLEALSTETGGRLFRTTRVSELRQAFLSVMDEFKSRYVLSYTPERVAAGGWHAVDVRLKSRRGRVIARKGYVR